MSANEFEISHGPSTERQERLNRKRRALDDELVEFNIKISDIKAEIRKVDRELRDAEEKSD